MERLIEYSHKCKILRQIQSNKARIFKRINTWQNLLTVIVSSFITFMGFSGTEQIKKYVDWFIVIELEKVEFVFNLFVFLLFILVILHLVFQFGKKQSDAERAIVTISSLLNQIDDIIHNYRSNNISENSGKVDLIRQKYETVVEIIPSNSDKDYLTARKDLSEKELKKVKQINITKELFDEVKLQIILIGLIRDSETIMKILKNIRNVNEELYLGGGIIRNLVWDYLHDYKNPTPIEDVDVIYFDQLSVNKEFDTKFENKLKKTVPNYEWSVKNQSRMHMINNDQEYQSLEDAISKWPETCTAFLVKLNDENELEFISPYGFEDLFRMIVVPTNHFASKIDKYEERIKKKNWIKTFPKLKILTNTEVNEQTTQTACSNLS